MRKAMGPAPGYRSIVFRREVDMRAVGWIGLASVLGSALGALGVRRAFRRDMKDMAAALETGSALLATDFGALEYGREGIGPHILVSHGAGGGYDQGLFVGRELLGSNFDVVAPSRFGYLRSASPAQALPDAQADAYAALLDHLRIERVAVLGISAGAPSAIEMALRHPERVSALILVVPRAFAPGVEVSAPASPQNDAIMRMIERAADFAYWSATRLARSSLLRFLGVPPEVDKAADPLERDRLTWIMRHVLPLSRRVEGLRNDGATRIAPWPLERIHTPTFVVSAEDDLFGTLPAARFTADHIAGAELMVLASGGHLLAGRSEEIRARIAGFLRRNASLPHKQAA
jgi:pimeloyl-ACP methyl ester carboxylesterase